MARCCCPRRLRLADAAGDRMNAECRKAPLGDEFRKEGGNRMAEGTIAQAAPAILSVQQRLDQIGAAIEEAHTICRTMMIFDEAIEKTPTEEGALPGADRCINQLALLNERLNMISERVGHL